ncbi:MAG: hypothetical protein LC772_10945 [Chloroflexi bacterium]|nr:hypothetical protein [Chloroflexota bacterium]
MKCRQCGRKNPWQSEFCAGCGGSLEPPPPPPPQAPETGAESSRWVIIWTAVAVLVVAVLCYFAFMPEAPFKSDTAPDPGSISGVVSTRSAAHGAAAHPQGAP